MKHAEWIAWLALGVYCTIAAIGGSIFCAAMTLPCGYMVGALSGRRSPEQPE